MKRLKDEVINFLRNQGFVIVSTIDSGGAVHNSCKGIINISSSGTVYLLDLYKSRTFANLKQDSHISITAVDEHSFSGWCLKGRGKIVERGKLESQDIRAWENKIISRVTKRLIKNIREEKVQGRHPEVLLPEPEYMIIMKTEEVIDLSPQSPGRQS